MDHTLSAIGERVAGQDNHCTAEPLFVVFQKHRIYGINLEYEPDFVWVDTEGDFCEADDRQHRILERMEERGRDTGRWERLGYVDTDRFVTACFTEAAAQAFIDARRHNLNKPFIYVESLYRNHEMIAVRHSLLGAAPEKAEAA
ncbi:hypothetical protein ACHMW5_13415 [Azospirillum melinis]|uniref:hypothetical protein n=1 Tax=Azospirillum melinis TaxID=328839 RepID=UPI003757E967